MAAYCECRGWPSDPVRPGRLEREPRRTGGQPPRLIRTSSRCEFAIRAPDAADRTSGPTSVLRAARWGHAARDHPAIGRACARREPERELIPGPQAFMPRAA